jgi:hypothetical protein
VSTGTRFEWRCSAIGALAACACIVAGCLGDGTGGATARTSAAAASAAPPAAAGAAGAAGTTIAAAVPHGNHDPKYGGVVLMNGDLHFEVVLRRDGRHEVYFSDATRAELPAAIASSVTVKVTRAEGAPETIDLHIDESGEYWAGQGRRVDGPAPAARIAYTSKSSPDKPYWIDLPFPPATTAAR